MKALGILGGSFDPIHRGHIMLAQNVYEKLDLERVIFVPAYVAPHKIGQSYASPEDRYCMTELAVDGISHFSVSDVEFKKKGISYTFETLRIMKQQFPNQDLYFIIGADGVPQLDSWHHIDEIFELAKFAVVYRPGYEEEIALAKQRFGENSKKIIMIETPEDPVSSTLVRENIVKKLPLTGLVAPAVEQYIQEWRLYQK
ncbi:MAG: nicotinate-nucleotide adenylyltransferase [Acidaminococcaceae bacterium]|nr:nicotinate-nucleotide adenylyltransferase [Acidaminococcaceae bacterium]